jgi:hypothetical protein
MDIVEEDQETNQWGGRKRQVPGRTTISMYLISPTKGVSRFVHLEGKDPFHSTGRYCSILPGKIVTTMSPSTGRIQVHDA